MANPRLCSIPACGKPHMARSYCENHYYRWRRYGGPLAGNGHWGEPKKFVAEVVLAHTGDECLMWPFASKGFGYGSICVDGKSNIASRYVCELVNGPAPSPEHHAAHLCGKGHLGCVSPSHLEWKTKIENEADKVVHGTHMRGERHKNVKLSAGQVKIIRSLKGIEPAGQIAERFSVTRTAVSAIWTRRTWGWLV